MAMTVAFAPLSKIHSDPVLNAFNDPTGSFASLACGFDSTLACVKTEPCTEDPMDDSPFPPPSFTPLSAPSPFTPASSSSPSFTELSPATLATIKQGTTDLYAEGEESDAFSSWTYKHPEHWDTREVLDWLYTLADTENFDGAIFRGENYNKFTGRQLCSMTLADFVSLDNTYGARVHEIFNWLLEDANFRKPCPPERDPCPSEPLYGNVPAFLACPRDVTSTRTTHHAPSSSERLSVFVGGDGGEMVVSVDGLGLYPIDISVISSKDSFRNIGDSDYNSDPDMERSNSVTSDVFDDIGSDDDSACHVTSQPTQRGRKSNSPSLSSDSGCEDDRRPTTRRRQASTSKGNHLWEFVRDLLKDPLFNPSLLRWEDRELGVFKFVQSEAVAQMWGRKKNNPGMTYEKLSRAMRFCRSAGYFASVPKTGRFPKKLCFKFGHKAEGWSD